MKNTFLFIFIIFLPTAIYSQDSLTFKGQASVYTHFNPENESPVWVGGRYIPQANYEYKLKNRKLIDFEASANIYGNYGFNSNVDNSNGDIKPYRLWARYSTPQFELRAGLQKINFGSATILRPLMWFDQLDPRDPLRLTDGVWGVLGRYYFLNNANVWLWALYGNKNKKGWELTNSLKDKAEFGGRIQSPIPLGEAAISYHHRKTNVNTLPSYISYPEVAENRFGFDVKMDVIVGCWLEASWSNFDADLGSFTNQEIINIGLDYTFGIGNGLTATYEHLIASYDEKPFELKNTGSFSLLNLSYPIGIFDNLTAIIYYDWKNNNAYNFITWQKQFNNISLFLMAYANPKDYHVPTQTTDEILYSKSGLQLMLVYNY